MYFNDGSIAQACPPLQALLHIMAREQWEGKGLDHPEVRALFTRENLLASSWYARRLEAKQDIDRELWKRHVECLTKFLRQRNYADVAQQLQIADRLERARNTLAAVESPEYLEQLTGTLGAEPIQNYLSRPQ
jgi:hypothetical protein